MRKSVILILIVVSTYTYSQNHLPTIKSSVSKISIRDGDNFKKNSWTLSPKLKPDVYKTFVKSKKRVTFYSDIDSISFVVNKNKIYDFNILYHKDTCWTRINTIPDFHFDKKYIERHRRKFSYEIPEVQELALIIVALTPTGLENKILVKHNTEYYGSVLKKFGKYKDEPIVSTFDSLLRIGDYSDIKMDASAFRFKKDKIIKGKYYNILGWGDTNFLNPYIYELEKFARKTDFRKFYKENSIFYKNLTEELESETPIAKQWKWLENKFDNKYDNYRIIFSPLVNGSHSTQKFIQDDFKQSVMFICGPRNNRKYNTKVNEGLMTRVVFTEIDHNYVNPVSDKFLNEINRSLQPIKKWATSGALHNYKNAYSVFNEYMTWAVYSLYAYENFSEKDFNDICEVTENLMVESRGFLKFNEFNQELLRLYREHKSKIELLYPEILAWCKNQ